jgi:hypothetical protein
VTETKDGLAWLFGHNRIFITVWILHFRESGCFGLAEFLFWEKRTERATGVRVCPGRSLALVRGARAFGMESRDGGEFRGGGRCVVRFRWGTSHERAVARPQLSLSR